MSHGIMHGPPVDLDAWRKKPYSNDPADWTRLATMIVWKALLDTCSSKMLKKDPTHGDYKLDGHPYPMLDFVQRLECQDPDHMVLYELTRFFESQWGHILTGAVGVDDWVMFHVYHKALYDTHYHRTLKKRLHCMWTGESNHRHEKQAHYWSIREKHNKKFDTIGV